MFKIVMVWLAQILYYCFNHFTDHWDDKYRVIAKQDSWCCRRGTDSAVERVFFMAKDQFYCISLVTHWASKLD